jgi:hypothetical protein
MSTWRVRRAIQEMFHYNPPFIMVHTAVRRKDVGSLVTLI